MAERLVNIDRDTPMLLPPDLREWVPADDMVHFVIETISAMPLTALGVNRRGSGSAQYPPKMMMSLLIYCYANGIFSSRRIERATYRDVAVRYLTADTHPDHDTICKFRRENFEAVSEAFLQVLQLARELGVLQVGTISVDGTHIKADASLHQNVCYGRAKQLDEQLQRDIAELMDKAERSDADEAGDGQRIPDQITYRQNLRDKIQAARKRLEEQGRVQQAKERESYERKLQDHKDRNGRGRPPKPPISRPTEDDRVNMTDPESRGMAKNGYSGHMQAYNAQAVVDADGSQLILAGHVTNHPNDNGQLKPNVDRIPPSLGQPTAVLADAGYVNVEQIELLQDREIETYVAVTQKDNESRKRYDLRGEQSGRQRQRDVISPTLKTLREKMATKVGRNIYARRKYTVEPVFGIIKSVMGFNRFLLRGLSKVEGEWALVRLAYNFKRLSKLQGAV